LILRGADVNYAMMFGRTPLHEAARNGDRDTMKLLLDRGANVNAKDEAGDTPLDCAEDSEKKDLLRKHGAKKGQDLP
jgi:ankyrin repeat protein